MFWVLDIRTLSLRQFFEYPQHMFWLRNRKIIFNYYPSLVLVQPRKTRPYITERLLMGIKESNQTNFQLHSIRWRPRNVVHGIGL